MHRYRPNAARGDLPLEVYDRLHDPLKTTFANVKARWQQCRDAGISEAALGRADRYFLLTVLLKRRDAWHPWLFDRCREVEASPDGHLDLWAREHYKSTIITFAGIVQEVINDPEITICIFSHTRPAANKVLSQLKREFEYNEDMQDTYPDILWKYAKKDAPFWSLAKGITVKRVSNPPVATVEASGLDALPTGSHYKLRVYDDVVTKDAVNTSEQIAKTTESYQLSNNLGARGDDGLMREWMIGTRYSFADTYQRIIDNKQLKVRIYPATDDGLRTGNPVFLSRAALDEKLEAQETYVFACQQLQNPLAGTEAMFDISWLKVADIRPATLNVYIMCDPAGSQKKSSDNTAIAVIGYDSGRSMWLLDGYCHKMKLSERWTHIRDLRKHWMETPGVQNVFIGYENYSIPDALDHFEERMEIEKISFPIVILHWPRQARGSKNDRIMRLEPTMRAGKFYISKRPLDKDGKDTKEETQAQQAMKAQGQAFRIFRPQYRLDHNQMRYGINKVFVEEVRDFPRALHDDFLDATSRFYDMDPRPPIIYNERDLEPEVFSDGS